MNNNNELTSEFQALVKANILLPRIIFSLASKDPDILHALINVGRNRSIKSKLKNLDAVVMSNRLHALYLHMHYLRDEDPDFYTQITQYRPRYIPRLLEHELFAGYFNLEYTRTTARFAVAVGIVDDKDRLNPARYLDFALNATKSAWFKSLEA